MPLTPGPLGFSLHVHQFNSHFRGKPELSSLSLHFLPLEFSFPDLVHQLGQTKTYEYDRPTMSSDVSLCLTFSASIIVQCLVQA